MSIASNSTQQATTKTRGRNHRTVLDAIGDGVVVLDADAGVVDMNRSAIELLQLDSVESAPFAVSTFFPELAAAGSVAELLAHCGRGGVVETQLAAGRRGSIPVQVTASEADDGERKLCVLVIRDMRAIMAAQRRALQTERLAAIGETITALAHESRNALQRMQSCLTLLKLRGSDEMIELIQDMQDAQDQLQQLYEEVRDFAAPLQLRMRRTDVVNLIDKVRRQLRLKWTEKALTWSLDRPEDLDTKIRADGRRLGQVFRNVMENAIEASPPNGHIAIEVVEGAVGPLPALEIRIADQGNGIAVSDGERAFDLLYTTKPDGTGMGLAIARRIVREHDGDIVLENREEGGARVVVTLLRGE